jgi:hypothetical protein
VSQDPLFRDIPSPPSAITAGTVLARLAQGIGFRYRWATEGLSAEDLAFCPAEGSMTLGQLLEHIHGLVRWVGECVGLAPLGSTGRDSTLELVAALAKRFEAMTESDLSAVVVRTSRGETLPFWNLVNGPLADSLTHIGQVASWRRILGKPVPRADVFRGRPPEP